jgi:Zn finger protein HypA/HybF involved in hydrogenase expression
MTFKARICFRIKSILANFKENLSKMGHSYPYRCEHCGFQESFNEGHGFLIHSQPVKDYLEQRTKLFHYKTHNLVRELAQKNIDLYLKVGFQVFKCPKCRVLHDKVEVVVYKDDKVIHKSSFRCSDCRTRLKLTNIHRLKNASCPKCHKKTFHIDNTQPHLWD